MGLSRPGVLGFFGPDGALADPNDAEIVKVLDARGADELGVEYVDASELALIYTAARALQEIDGRPGPRRSRRRARRDDVRRQSDRRSDARRRGTGCSSRSRSAARAGGRAHRLLPRLGRRGPRARSSSLTGWSQTGRGWEVDAGTSEQRGEAAHLHRRQLREAELFDETFELPEEMPQLLEAKRATSRVRVELPQSGRWAADMYAESVTVVDDQETTAVLDIDLLPPLEHRLGLLLLAAGAEARVVEPVELGGAAANLAEKLLLHHS